ALASARAGFGDLEDLLLGFVDELARAQPLVVEDRSRDLGARLDQLPQEAALADDLGIRAYVCGGRRIPGECAEIGESAGFLQLAGTLELLGDGDHVARLAVAGKGTDSIED